MKLVLEISVFAARLTATEFIGVAISDGTNRSDLQIAIHASKYSLSERYNCEKTDMYLFVSLTGTKVIA